MIIKKSQTVGEHYEFAISENTAKMKPWSLINNGDTFPMDGGLIRAFVLPYGIGFKFEMNAPKELEEAVEQPATQKAQN